MIAITGASGVLGRYVVECLTSAGMHFRILTRQDLDLAQPAGIGVQLDDLRPSAIIHLAAETNVDLCERDPAHAARINGVATGEIARWAGQVMVPIVYISTSALFGADGRLVYNELDLPCPINYYGRSKLLGEQHVRHYCAENALILRCGWMIGGGRDDKKFVGKIFEQINAGTKHLKAVSDRFGTVTFAGQLAALVVGGLQSHLVGTYNFASEGLVSRFDLMHFIAAQAHFDGKLEAVPSAMFPLSAPRALSEGIATIFGDHIDSKLRAGDWRTDLSNYISTVGLYY
jgi:dTDP-4-dehydrorhamnose reductase